MPRSTRFAVAVHALTHLVDAPEPLTSEQLADCIGTNPVVVRRTLAGLREAGVVTSARGTGGGWALAHDPADISLRDVYAALGERLLQGIDVTGPAARDHVAMAYSPVQRGIVLHGGGTPLEGMLGDTWLYDGGAWTRMLDAGPARGRHRLLYDPVERAVLLYGGYDGRRRTSELWALRANAWERLAP